MAEAGFWVAWGLPTHRRERQALDLLNETRGYLARLAQDGQIERFDIAIQTLHGEGLRNPSIKSGDWTATPQDSSSQCRAEQQAVVGPGVVGPPQVAESPKGQPLSFQVVPRLFSIEMSGYCLWTRTDS